VVLVKRIRDFVINTTPSARLRSLRGILTSRSHPSSAEEGSRGIKKKLRSKPGGSARLLSLRGILTC